MKRILLFLVIFIIGLGGGAAGIVFLQPSLLSHTPAPVIESVPFHAKTAVSVTESGIQSNLAGQTHYIRFDVEFQVTPEALTTAGGSAKSSSGSTGTGSPVLDAKILNSLIALSRAMPYSLFQSSGGLTTFKGFVTQDLEAIFGPGTVEDVYFPNLITQ